MHRISLTWLNIKTEESYAHSCMVCVSHAYKNRWLVDCLNQYRIMQLHMEVGFQNHNVPINELNQNIEIELCFVPVWWGTYALCQCGGEPMLCAS